MNDTLILYFVLHVDPISKKNYKIIDEDNHFVGKLGF